MYQPSHFQENRPALLTGLIAAYPLATVLYHGAQGIEANLLPLLWQAVPGTPGKLIGHLAGPNPLAQADGQMVSVLFHGPDAYVSPNWYPSKAEQHKAVPTWNYAVVEARGRLHCYRDPARLTALLTELTTRFEAGQARPWRLEEAPADWLAQLYRVIVGVEIELDSLQGKFKLSQNRPAADIAGTLAGLRASGDSRSAALADWMERSAAATQA